MIDLLNRIFQVLTEVLALPFRILSEIINTATNIWNILFQQVVEEVQEEVQPTVQQTQEQAEYPEIHEVEGFQFKNVEK